MNYMQEGVAGGGTFWLSLYQFPPHASDDLH
jgi:hypothetical protein